MMKDTKNRLKPALVAVVLMTALAVGIMPMAQANCTNGLDERCTYPGVEDGQLGTGGAVDCADHDPGAPGTGTTGATLWFVGQGLFLACGFSDSTEDSVLLHVGDMSWKLGLVATGGADLFDTTGLAPAALVYESNMEDVTRSQVQDTCAVLIGDSNPNCGSDPDVSGSLACPNGAEIPNPIGGGLLGDTLDNSNGALQATCVLAGSWSASLPNSTQVLGYAGAVQVIVMSLNGDVFAFASEISDAMCIFLTGSTPCV